MTPSLNKQSKACLLVVDDEPHFLKMIESILVRASYEVKTCEKTTEGLKILEYEPFDCVITDALMPDMSGLEFVKELRKKPQFSNLPVLMLTRLKNRNDVQKAIEAGVSDYILKPIDEMLFLDKVELCIRKGLAKRQFFELPITGPLSQASLQFTCDILSLSETSLTIWSQMPLTDQTPLVLKTRLFQEIGIDLPSFKIVDCNLIPSSEEKFAGYIIKLSFLALSETELQKIRSWIQREALRQKK